MKAILGIVKALSWIVYAVIIAALAIAAPFLLGYRPVVVLSGSMEPVYPVGSIIYYKQASFEEIQVGDAITIKIGDGALATHRVLEKNETDRTFITKGDNNPSPDQEPVPFDRVVGRATSFAIPFAGYMTSFVQRWYVIAGMGLILLLDMVLGSLSKEDDEKSSKKNGWREVSVSKDADALSENAEKSEKKKRGSRDKKATSTYEKFKNL